MISSGAARVVLIGKSRHKDKHDRKGSILNDVNPTEIPKEFIDGISVTFDNKQIVEFDISTLEKNFTIEGMNNWISKIDSKGKIKKVEITLDLDLIYDNLQQNSDSIFAKYF